VATIADLSGNGAGLLSDQEAPNGAWLHLKFPLPSGGDDFEARGRVVSIRSTSSGRGQFHLGVRFEGLGRLDQERLVKALHHFQIEHRRRTLEYER
jgi:hypothetical protein